MVLFGLVWYDMVWYGMVMVWYCLVWYGNCENCDMETMETVISSCLLLLAEIL